MKEVGKTPITHEVNGYLKDVKTGRFAKGNKGGTGYPYAKRVCELRAALYESITAGDVKDVIGAMVHLAKQGDVSAARLILGYACQQPTFIDVDYQSSSVAVVAQIPRDQAMRLMAEHSNVT